MCACERVRSAYHRLPDIQRGGSLSTARAAERKKESQSTSKEEEVVTEQKQGDKKEGEKGRDFKNCLRPESRFGDCEKGSGCGSGDSDQPTVNGNV